MVSRGKRKFLFSVDTFRRLYPPIRLRGWGRLSSDLSPLLLRGVDQPIRLTVRLTDALVDRRHPSYVKHTLRDVYRASQAMVEQLIAGFATPPKAPARMFHLWRAPSLVFCLL